LQQKVGKILHKLGNLHTSTDSSSEDRMKM